MEKKFKIKQNKIQILVLLLVTIVHCAFICQKEGYHMDEMLSFELSNAEYNPWIVPTQPEGRLAKFMREEIDDESLGGTFQNLVAVVQDVLENKGNSKLLTFKADVYEEPVWIDRERFEAYVTTGQKDQFNLLSVYFNVKDDNHPPLHFMLLHLVSSLFPGTVSAWMGCVINLLALLGSCICMMKTGELLDEHSVLSPGSGKMWGILAAALYGCSAGAVATTLLIRMYGLMTFLCVLTFYIHVKKWLDGTFDKKNKGLIAVTILGFLTQYFFLFYCIVLAGVTFVLLLIYKRRREAFIYVRSMVIAAALGICMFPFAISDVFSSGRGVEALSNLQGTMSAFMERLAVFGQILLSGCFGGTWPGVVILLAAFCYAVYVGVKSKKVNGLFLMLLLPPLGYFLLAAKMSPMYVDRYIMATFPFVMMLTTLFAVKVTERLEKFRTQICVAVLACIACFSVFSYDGEYLYKGYEEQLEIAEEYGSLPCICVYEGYRFYDNLPEFTEYEKTLLVKADELLERKDTADIEQLQEVVILAKGSMDEEALQKILDKYGLVIEKVLLEDGVYNDDVYLCKKSIK